MTATPTVITPNTRTASNWRFIFTPTMRWSTRWATAAAAATAKTIRSVLTSGGGQRAQALQDRLGDVDRRQRPAGRPEDPVDDPVGLACELEWHAARLAQLPHAARLGIRAAGLEDRVDGSARRLVGGLHRRQVRVGLHVVRGQEGVLHLGELGGRPVAPR